MNVIIAIPYVLAACAWLIAMASWVLAVGHRKPEVKLTTLLLAGYKSFDADNFTPEGQRHQRRFVLAFAGFFLCVVAGVVMAMLFAGR